MRSDRPNRILVVDDSEIVLGAVADELEALGWHVIEAIGGEQALEIVGSEVLDVVVCDLHMPGMDGYEVLRGLAEFDSDLPVLIHSGESDLSAVLSAMRQGAFDYVLKRKGEIEHLHTAASRAAKHYRVVRENRRLDKDLRTANAELEERNRALAQARDKALEASRAKSLFLANMSHELRTPLNAILGYTEMLTEDAVAEGQSQTVQDLERVRSAASHLLALISAVLDLSKIEAGRVEVDLSKVNVPDFVEETVATMRPLVERNGNEFEVAIDPGLHDMVTDESLVRQCLLNLLANAAKFTCNGRVRLEVARIVDRGIPFVAWAVIDTGIGMSEADCQRVFGEFVQADASTSRRYGGTGLGLAITKRLCEHLGGHVSVRSRLGEGSTFTIVLPMQPRDTRLDTPYQALRRMTTH